MERHYIEWTEEQKASIGPMFEARYALDAGSAIVGQVFEDGIYLRLLTPDRAAAISEVCGGKELKAKAGVNYAPDTARATFELASQMANASYPSKLTPNTTDTTSAPATPETETT